MITDLQYRLNPAGYLYSTVYIYLKRLSLDSIIIFKSAECVGTSPLGKNNWAWHLQTLDIIPPVSLHSRSSFQLLLSSLFPLSQLPTAFSIYFLYSTPISYNFLTHNCPLYYFFYYFLIFSRLFLPLFSPLFILFFSINFIPYFSLYSYCLISKLLLKS